jgi:hypothetical protein
MEFFSLLHGVNMVVGVMLAVLAFGFLLSLNEDE